MTMFYSAQNLKRVRRLHQSCKQEATSPVSTSESTPEPNVPDRVTLVLHGGDELDVMIEGLEDDGATIFGTFTDGRLFAIPIINVKYCVEC